MNTHYIIYSLIVATLAAACTGTTVFYRFAAIAPTGWERADTVSFGIPPAEADCVRHEELAIRTDSSYPFQTVSVIVTQRILPAGVVVCDTVQCRLYDKSGKPRGRGTALRQHHFHITDIRLEQGDSLAVSIRHNMRRETLPGITDVGLEVSAK